MKKSIAKILYEAANLIDQPGAWCQHSYALDSEGNGVHPSEYNAVSWCMLGAIRKITNKHYSDTCRYMVRYLGEMSLSSFNDASDCTQEKVVLALRNAAKAYVKESNN